MPLYFRLDYTMLKYHLFTLVVKKPLNVFRTMPLPSHEIFSLLPPQKDGTIRPLLVICSNNSTARHVTLTRDDYSISVKILRSASVYLLQCPLLSDFKYYNLGIRRRVNVAVGPQYAQRRCRFDGQAGNNH